MPETLSVPREEFQARCSAALKEAAHRGYDGLLVWGRGGNTLDAYADLFYLTDHYPRWPPHRDDDEGVWSNLGYGAAVLAPPGDVHLVVDFPGNPDKEVYATHVIPALDHHPTNVVAKVLKDAGLGAARLGLVGHNCITGAQLAVLHGQLPELQLIPADDIVDHLRIIKSAAEQELIRRACLVGSEALSIIMQSAAPGLTQAQIMSPGIAHVIAKGGAPYGMWAYSYGPTIDYSRHRLPAFNAQQPLSEGDVLAIDISGSVGGYFFDHARTLVLGGKQNASGRLVEAIAAAKAAVEAVENELRPGNTIGDAARRGVEVLKKAGISPVDTLWGYEPFGHGLGLNWGSPLLLPTSETEVAAGMYVTVEKILMGGWLLWEDDVLVTRQGPEILSKVSMPG